MDAIGVSSFETAVETAFSGAIVSIQKGWISVQAKAAAISQPQA
jgi:hypothetical protein